MKKLFKTFSMLIASGAIVALPACNDENLDAGRSDDNGVNADNGVYFSINVDLPMATGSRSATNTGEDDDYSSSNSGVEIGKDYENEVNSVLIVLARQSDNGFIAFAETDESKYITSITQDRASYQITSSFSLTTLSAYYDKMEELKLTDFSCNIFVFANPGDQMRAIIKGGDGKSAPSLFSTAWLNGKIDNLGEATYDNATSQYGGGYLSIIANTEKGFLMSNATIATRQIPSSLEDWRRHYTTESNPFDLSGDNNEVFIDNGVSNNRGPVKLERAAARFDFRDGSPLAPDQPFTYHVVRSGDGEDKNKPEEERTPLIDIVLSNMSLVNVNKEFYALRRVTADGVNTIEANGNVAGLCKPEKRWTYTNGILNPSSGNYVVDANQVWKKATVEKFIGDNSSETTDTPTSTVAVDYSANFNYPLFTNDGAVNTPSQARRNWLTSHCATVAAGEADNDEGWTQEPKGDYRIWTYATENTIAPYQSQKNGISTGVVFKGKMVATEAAKGSLYPDIQKLADAISNANSNSPMLYSFGGNLYVGWDEIRNAAIAKAVTGIKWVPDNESDPTKGKFEFDNVERTDPLYVAVFGNGGFGSKEFTYTEYDVNTGKPVEVDGKVVQYTGTITDDLGITTNCADKKMSKYLAITGNSTQDEYNRKEALSDFKKAATGANITIYQTSQDDEDGWGYYCYYFYWNRHNDNGEPGIMGPMEFAVVRNNVYKLAVTNIKKLGHPRHSENDPDRPTGDTDDEKENVYLSVTAQVLPWVVRVNDIEF